MSNRETMQQALEALETKGEHHPRVYAAINALKTALAQPEQEPVAFYHPRSGFYWAKPTHISAPTVVDVEPLPLYVAAERNNG